MKATPQVASAATDTVADDTLQATMKSLVTLFAKSLISVALTSKNQSVSVKQIEKAHDYLIHQGELFDRFACEAERSLYQRGESAAINRLRQHTFNRLIVRAFEEHLSHRNQPLLRDPNKIPREALPAFFYCINAILGDQRAGECRAACEKVRDEVQATHGLSFSWDHLYGHRGAMRVAQDAVSLIVIYFREKFDLRCEWLIKHMNYNFMPQRSQTGGLSSAYLFDRRRLRLLLLALIKFVDGDQMTPADQAVLMRNIGAERVKMVRKVKLVVKNMEV